jgi:hypothetical protein
MALHEANLVLPLSGRAAVLLNLSDPGQLLGSGRLAVASARSKGSAQDLPDCTVTKYVARTRGPELTGRTPQSLVRLGLRV